MREAGKVKGFTAQAGYTGVCMKKDTKLKCVSAVCCTGSDTTTSCLESTGCANNEVCDRACPYAITAVSFMLEVTAL